MTDLDRFITYHNQLVIDGVHPDKERELECKALYDKLKLALEFYESDIGEKVHHIINSFMRLEKNQKTNSDIEKIKKYDSIYDSSSTQYMLKQEQEIVQLKSENNEYVKGIYGILELNEKIVKLETENKQLKEESMHDKKYIGLLEEGMDSFRELKQSSKSNKFFCPKCKGEWWVDG